MPEAAEPARPLQSPADQRLQRVAQLGMVEFTTQSEGALAGPVAPQTDNPPTPSLKAEARGASLGAAAVVVESRFRPPPGSLRVAAAAKAATRHAR